MINLKLKFRDIDETMVIAWEKAFQDINSIDISQGDIFELKADGIISPANSFGFMDGGIDAIYSKYFGWDLQDRLQEKIITEFDGELPVGQATIVETKNESIPYLISAPTMRVPMDVSDTLNAYLAFRAALRAIKEHNNNSQNKIETVLCPGLCTASGKMPHERSAKQMLIAYQAIVLGQIRTPLHPGRVLNEHYRLMR